MSYLGLDLHIQDATAAERIQQKSKWGTICARKELIGTSPMNVEQCKPYLGLIQYYPIDFLYESGNIESALNRACIVRHSWGTCLLTPFSRISSPISIFVVFFLRLWHPVCVSPTRDTTFKPVVPSATFDRGARFVPK